MLGELSAARLRTLQFYSACSRLTMGQVNCSFCCNSTTPVQCLFYMNRASQSIVEPKRMKRLLDRVQCSSLTPLPASVASPSVNIPPQGRCALVPSRLGNSLFEFKYITLGNNRYRLTSSFTRSIFRRLCNVRSQENYDV